MEAFGIILIIMIAALFAFVLIYNYYAERKKRKILDEIFGQPRSMSKEVEKKLLGIIEDWRFYATGPVNCFGMKQRLEEFGKLFLDLDEKQMECLILELERILGKACDNSTAALKHFDVDFGRHWILHVPDTLEREPVAIRLFAVYKERFLEAINVLTKEKVIFLFADIAQNLPLSFSSELERMIESKERSREWAKRQKNVSGTL